MAISPFLTGILINTSLSIGFNLIGEWLRPKDTNKTPPEDVPTLNRQPLYSIWGTSSCAAQIYYALNPKLVGASENTSSFGVLTIANPDSTATLLALKVNNILCSTSSPKFKLNAPESLIKPSNKYTNSYGLSTYFGMEYTQQLSTPTSNPDYATLGFPGLQYEGLSWLRFIRVDRDKFGGFNSRFTTVYKNRATSSGSETYNIINNNPVSVTINLKLFSLLSGTTVIPTSFNYPSGFHGYIGLVPFIQGGANGLIDHIGVGGGADYVIRIGDTGSWNSPDFTVTTSVITGGVPTPPGQFTNNTMSLGTAIGSTPATTQVIVGALGQPLRAVTLSSPKLGRFFSDSSGNIYDNTNTVVATANPGERVYGWGGAVVVSGSGGTYVPISSANVTSGSSQPSGTLSNASTDLATILSDLLKSKGVTASEIVFPPVLFTNVTVRGFTATTNNVKESIINLCSAYAKIIDDSSGNGEYRVIDYPSYTQPANFVVSYRDLIEEPEILINEPDQQITQLELTYRDYDFELSERLITVGFVDDYPNKESRGVDLVLTQQEAKRVAWNWLFLLYYTDTLVRLRLSNAAGFKVGDVIAYTHSDGVTMRLLVANIEIGSDRTYLVNLVNIVDLRGVESVYSATTGVTFQTLFATNRDGSIPVLPSNQVELDTNIIPAEPISNDFFDKYGGSLFTTSSPANYEVWKGNLAQLSITPSTVGFRGVLLSASSALGELKYGQVKATITGVGTIPPSGLIRLGTSWVTYSSFVTSGSNLVLTVDEIGMFGSSVDLIPGITVYYINPNNKVKGASRATNANYVKQGSNSYFNTGLTKSDKSVDLFGVPTSYYPYGTPCPGYCDAQLAASYNNGTLRLWFSQPGNRNSTSPFDDNSTTNGRDSGDSEAHYWCKPLVGAPFFLFSKGTIVQQNIAVLSVTIPQGSYTIYTAKLGGGLLDEGSYSWTFYSYG